MVELIADDGVFIAEDRLEEPAVGVPARTVKDRVVLAEEASDTAFELLVNLLRTANEPHRGHAVAEFLQAFGGGSNNLGVIGKAEVVVGAEVDDVLIADANART